MTIPFLRISKVLLPLSTLLALCSLVLFIYPGPKFSIEFTGGTLLEVRLPAEVLKEQLQTALPTIEVSKTPLDHVTVSAISNLGGKSFLLRTRPLSNEEHLEKQFTSVEELKYTTIGPSLSSSLKQRAFMAIAIASVAIIAYLALAFRKMPKKLAPWKFGALAVIGFIHDVLLVTGLFVIISQFTSFEFDTLFVTALLTILAYSANDSIVIFDRIRANVTNEHRGEDLGQTVNRALNQCVTRTINTMVTALIMLVALFVLGTESIRWFVLALIVGTIVGAYSSYFVASPLLVYWRKK
jgi:preprotein translocase subunit SecF